MKRAPYFSELLIPHELVTIESQVRLWRAVIDQALIDFLTNNKSREAQVDKQKAKIWLRGKSKDFSLVCEYAELNAREVRKEVFNIVGGEHELYRQ
jgi:hypothetical protein|tara:strand:+ start:350 stop:637 length:288 start_codon:yes stop_codon:yes gene_type:complete